MPLNIVKFQKLFLSRGLHRDYLTDILHFEVVHLYLSICF